MAARALRCPTCRGETEPGSRYRPFCSERCKMVDLGRWFRGEYVVAGEAAVAFDPELGEPDPGLRSPPPEDEGGSSDPEA